MRNDVLTVLSVLAIGLLAVVPSTATGPVLDSLSAPSSSFGDVYAYPNPATETSAVTFHAGIEDASGIEFRVYDAAGQQVHEVQLSGDPSTIGGARAYEYKWNFGNLASGAYFLVAKAQKENGQATIARKTFVVVR